MVKIGDIVNNNKHLCNFYPLRPRVNMNMASENVLISYNTKLRIGTSLMMSSLPNKSANFADQQLLFFYSLLGQNKQRS